MQEIKYKNTHSLVNIKLIILFLSTITLLNSCKKDNLQSIPSYISISEISFNTDPETEGANTHNITDVWLYVDNQFRGTFELPATIPLLHKDSTTIKVFAGIKDNGISGTRVMYYFYKSYEENVFLEEDEVTTISPKFEYITSAEFKEEGFDRVTRIVNTTPNSEVDLEEIKIDPNNHYGSGTLDGNHLTFEIAIDSIVDLPQGGSPVYMELDYKSSHQLLVGAYINYAQTVVNSELLWITPKEDWHKIYVNMTKTVSESIDNEGISFYINMFRTDTNETAWFLFDNIKIIYQK